MVADAGGVSIDDEFDLVNFAIGNIRNMTGAFNDDLVRAGGGGNVVEPVAAVFRRGCFLQNGRAAFDDPDFPRFARSGSVVRDPVNLVVVLVKAKRTVTLVGIMRRMVDKISGPSRTLSGDNDPSADNRIFSKLRHCYESFPEGPNLYSLRRQ